MILISNLIFLIIRNFNVFFRGKLRTNGCGMNTTINIVHFYIRGKLSKIQCDKKIINDFFDLRQNVTIKV